MMQPLLEIQQCSLTIEKTILSDINYQVSAGDFVIILGSNGSGKSSLLKLIDRRYHPTTGDIFLEEKLLTDYSDHELARRVRTLTQNFQESLFASLTVLENYLLVQHQYEKELLSLKEKKERQFLENYLAPFNRNLPKKLDQMVDKLSGGEKQALAFALTVLHPPTILLLDEHTSALDPHSADQLMALTQTMIEKFHITCLMTTHDLDIAEKYGNRILALRHGQIFQTVEAAEKKSLNRELLLAACY